MRPQKQTNALLQTWIKSKTFNSNHLRIAANQIHRNIQDPVVKADLDHLRIAANQIHQNIQDPVVKADLDHLRIAANQTHRNMQDPVVKADLIRQVDQTFFAMLE
jgi:hypothetical protein